MSWELDLPEERGHLNLINCAQQEMPPLPKTKMRLSSKDLFMKAVMSIRHLGTKKRAHLNAHKCSVGKEPAVLETRDGSLGWEDPLEKEMATHSSILAWKISWTEEPGGLQSMGSQRVRHDCATNTLTNAISIQVVQTVGDSCVSASATSTLTSPVLPGNQIAASQGCSFPCLWDRKLWGSLLFSGFLGQKELIQFFLFNWLLNI